MNAIYTVGHSNHPWEIFERLLKVHKITALADVRSFPRSRFAQFNRSTLQTKLAAAGVTYSFFGRDLGGRTDDGGIVDYEAIASTAPFRSALSCIEEIAANRCLVMMCSEHDPLICHRCLLVGRALAERGDCVHHILRDGTIEPHGLTEDRLVANFRRRQPTGLFDDPAQSIVNAYRYQAERLRRVSG